MAGLAVLLTALSQFGLLNPFQGLFMRVSTPFEKASSGIFQPVATLLADAGNLNELQDENRRLRLENEELRNQVSSLEGQSERVKELEAALAIPAASGSQNVPANIVARISQPFTDTISIDRGSSSGIRAGMVVLTSQGSLLGTVTSVESNRSFVRLITDSRSKVSAQVQESSVLGIIHGGANRTLSFEFAETGSDIAVGDTITTSGLGGNYPADLPIGRVTAVTGTPQDLFRRVTVEPLVRLSTAKTVLVNTSFAPLRVADSE